MASWPGAHRIVQVAPRQIFVNCGRYIHEAVGGLRLSRHLPDAQGTAAVPEVETHRRLRRCHLPGDDRQVAREGGRLAFEDYAGER